jgi:hypothetical protein
VIGEAVLDFMFWPSAELKVGWYVEPRVTAGPLIAIP